MVKFCQNCGTKVIDEKSLFCNKCGATLPQREEEDKIKSCPNCGQRIMNKNAPFCISCGFQFDANEPIKKSINAKKRKASSLNTGLFYTAIGISLVIFLFGVSTIIFESNTNKNVSGQSSAGVYSNTPNPSYKPTVTINPYSPDQLKKNVISISYDDLFRNNEQHIGKIIKIHGRIIQVSRINGDNYVFRVATKQDEFTGSYYNDVVWINYNGKRYLEDDIIDVWGVVKGLSEYSAIFGNQVTIPAIDAKLVELYVENATASN